MAHVRQSTQLPSLKTLTFDGNVLPDGESTNSKEKRLISRVSSEKQMRNHSRVSNKSEKKSSPRVGTVLIADPYSFNDQSRELSNELSIQLER